MLVSTLKGGAQRRPCLVQYFSPWGTFLHFPCYNFPSHSKEQSLFKRYGQSCLGIVLGMSLCGETLFLD